MTFTITNINNITHRSKSKRLCAFVCVSELSYRVDIVTWNQYLRWGTIYIKLYSGRNFTEARVDQWVWHFCSDFRLWFSCSWLVFKCVTFLVKFKKIYSLIIPEHFFFLLVNCSAWSSTPRPVCWRSLMKICRTSRKSHCASTPGT